jgi:hypothetical protein
MPTQAKPTATSEVRSLESNVHDVSLTKWTNLSTPALRRECKRRKLKLKNAKKATKGQLVLLLLDDENSRINPVNQWVGLSVKELKEECKKRGLTRSGTKQVLLDRLKGFDPAAAAMATIPNESVPDPGPENEWTGLTILLLKEECKKRGLVVGGKKEDLILRLVQFKEEEERVAKVTIPMRELSETELLNYQEMEELLHEMDCRKEDLIEYRGHMARHLSEDTWAAEKLEKLEDDEAIVTSDYKMKLLSCFFRENQKKWFGKRGTSLLGFMIATNPIDEESKVKGIKDVTFVMMVTDDCLQDDWEVACAKSVVYKDYLPAHVKRAHFVSDGAGCFKSSLHRALQPFWKVWTGVDEVTYRITPAGNGKSALDGMFGRLNTVLRSAVDGGLSYWNSETIAGAIEESNGLASTQFARFAPERVRQLEVDVSSMNFESVLLTILDPARDGNDQSTVAFKHSGFGDGKKILPTKHINFFWRKNTGNKKKKKQDLTPIEGVYHSDGTINEDVVMTMEPKCILFMRTENLKSSMTTKLAKSGEGAGLAKVRQAKKRKRKESKAQTMQEQLEDERAAMQATGKLFLCDATCPRTQRYCRSIYLTKKGLDEHVAIGKHGFPKGQNARDFIIREASMAGGLVQAGSRPDRQQHVLFEEIVASQAGVRGEQDACSFGRFNRRENALGYRKPPMLLKVLEELYNREPKLRACEMREIMRRMRDEDGGLLFCFSKRNTTGMLLLEDQIQSWINSTTKKKKKERTKKDDMEDGLICAHENA